jgi:hypothetical protein
LFSSSGLESPLSSLCFIEAPEEDKPLDSNQMKVLNMRKPKNAREDVDENSNKNLTWVN